MQILIHFKMKTRSNVLLNTRAIFTVFYPRRNTTQLGLILSSRKKFEHVMFWPRHKPRLGFNFLFSVTRMSRQKKKTQKRYHFLKSKFLPKRKNKIRALLKNFLPSASPIPPFFAKLSLFCRFCEFLPVFF